MVRRWGIVFDIFVIIGTALLVTLIVVASIAMLARPFIQDWNGDAPPLEYRGSAVASVAFIPPEDVSAICGKDNPPPAGIYIVACSWPTKFGEGVIIMPDPCAWADTEYYAKIQCHENAHLRGWVHG